MVKIVMRIEHVQIYQSGKKTYVYYRRGGVRLRIMREPDDAQGIRDEVARIERELAATGEATELKYEFGTLGWLVECYKRDPEWWPENESTRKSYQRAFDAIHASMKYPLAVMTLPQIIRIRDEVIFPTRGRWMANYVVTVLSVVFKFGHETGRTTTNPLAGRVRKRRKAKGAKRVNRAWTEAERTTVLAKAPDHVRLVLALAMCTGLRKADLFKATLSAIKDGEITIRTSKRDKLAKIPVHPLLAEAIAARPKSDSVQIAVRRDGLPYTPDGFDTIWHRLRTGLEKDGLIDTGLTIHGLRHTFGTMLIEAGMDPDHVRRLLTHSNSAQTAEYTETAELPKKAKAQVVKLNIRARTANKSV
jgi:integrase